MLCVQLLNIEALVKIFSNLKLVTGKLPYSGKLLREKTFANFAVLWQYTKVFFRKIWGHGILWQKQAIHKSFLRENCIFHQFAKVFSLESLPLYGSLLQLSTTLTMLTALRRYLLFLDRRNTENQLTALNLT